MNVRWLGMTQVQEITDETYWIDQLSVMCETCCGEEGWQESVESHYSQSDAVVFICKEEAAGNCCGVSRNVTSFFFFVWDVEMNDWILSVWWNSYVLIVSISVLCVMYSTNIYFFLTFCPSHWEVLVWHRHVCHTSAFFFLYLFISQFCISFYNSFSLYSSMPSCLPVNHKCHSFLLCVFLPLFLSVCLTEHLRGMSVCHTSVSQCSVCWSVCGEFSIPQPNPPM